MFLCFCLVFNSEVSLSLFCKSEDPLDDCFVESFPQLIKKIAQNSKIIVFIFPLFVRS